MGRASNVGSGSGFCLGPEKDECACSQGARSTCECAVPFVDAFPCSNAIAYFDAFAFGDNYPRGHDDAYGYHDPCCRQHGAYGYYDAHGDDNPCRDYDPRGNDDPHDYNQPHNDDDSHRDHEPFGSGEECIAEGWRIGEYTSERLDTFHQPQRHADFARSRRRTHSGE
jgi:hypothetical protein